MKSKLLPISLFTLILGIASIILATGLTGVPGFDLQSGDTASTNAKKYFSKIRQNQITHRVNPVDELNAKAKADALALKSGDIARLNWQSMGPDNTPGTIRALLFDNQSSNPQSLILAGVTGGVWRTENLGATWTKLNQANQNLKVTCMVQDSDGTIFAGTGNGFCSGNDDIYYGGIVGEGIFKSTDQNNFTVLEATRPTPTAANDTVDFAYTYDLALDKANNRLYSATNTGLWFTDDKGESWNKVTRYEYDSITFGVNLKIDSTIVCDNWYIDPETGELKIEGINQQASNIDTLLHETSELSRIDNEKQFGKVVCTAVKVTSDGFVFATFNNLVYVSQGGADPIFKNISSNPKNFDMFSREITNYTTTLTVIDTTDVYNRGQVTFTDSSAYSNVQNPNSPYSKANQDRTQIAIAPSDENVIYITCSTSAGNIENIYLSTDRGNTWAIIFPGGSSSLEIFNKTACSNNVLTVFPNNPFKVLVGGRDMWLGEQIQPTGYYDWGAGPISTGFGFPGLDYYLPFGHHQYLFFPNSDSKLAIATDEGVSFGTLTNSGPVFEQIVRGLSNAQVYSVGPSGDRLAYLSGIESHRTQYVSGIGNAVKTGINVAPFNFTSPSGGSCKVSIINPNVFIASSMGAQLNRSSDQGESYSLNFTLPNSLVSSISVIPFVLWESVDDQLAKTTVKFKADKTYYKGDILACKSANRGIEGGGGYPFSHTLEMDSLQKGDSLMVKDIVQTKFFMAANNAIFMTRDMIKFDSIITFDNSINNRKNVWKIAAFTDASSISTCISVSKDANYCFVGTENGRIIRVSNIQAASNSRTGDIESAFTVIADDEIFPTEFAGRYITSISVDQQDPAHVIVTLGNYGNESYVYQTKNALDGVASVVFKDITGDVLPKMPVYSSLIEMSNSNVGIIGTEYGVYSTQNLTDDVPVWEFEPSNIGRALVVNLQQQTIHKTRIELQGPDPSVPPLVYKAVNNWGDIYCATFGRGVFRDDTFRKPVGIEELESSNGSISKLNINVYPNPVVADANISFELPSKQNVSLQIFNISGQAVKTIQLSELAKGNHTIPFNCSDLIQGMYILQLQANGQSSNTKFIVK